MQQKGSKKGSPGASGYAPGHEMQNKGSKKADNGRVGLRSWLPPGPAGNEWFKSQQPFDQDKEEKCRLIRRLYFLGLRRVERRSSQSSTRKLMTRPDIKSLTLLRYLLDECRD